jgi:hypothetical protein
MSWLRSRPWECWLVAATVLVTGGCVDELEVDAISVLLQTGANATDQNIHLCFTRLDTFQYRCANLDTDANDFESGATDQFVVPLGDEISLDDAGGLPTVADLSIENHGGGFMSDGWDMAGFRVEALLDDGTTAPICHDSGLSVSLDSGDSYVPPSCP